VRALVVSNLVSKSLSFGNKQSKIKVFNAVFWVFLSAALAATFVMAVRDINCD